jgi:hypothetical protein
MHLSDVRARWLRDRLQTASLLIADADLRHTPDGWVAAVTLDPLMVKLRGAEQGLADASVATAVADPRIHHAIDAVRRRVNAGLAPTEQIKGIDIIGAGHGAGHGTTAHGARTQRALVVASLARGA